MRLAALRGRGGGCSPAAPAGGCFAAKCRDAQTFGVLANGRIGRNQCQRLALELGLTLQQSQARQAFQVGAAAGQDYDHLPAPQARQLLTQGIDSDVMFYVENLCHLNEPALESGSQ